MKFCFVGAGSIGKRHIRNLKVLSEEEGFSAEIHLLRSSYKKIDQDIKNIVSREWHSVSEITEEYDAIFITNPTYLHYKTLEDLKNKSRFFFVEKPVFECTNVDLTIFENLKDNVYYVACPLRYTKVLQRAKEIADKNEIISVRAISSSYLPDWRPGADYRKTYSAHKDQGGGVKIDLIHEWDYLIHLFGFPQRVYQFYGKYSDLEIESEDVAVYIAKYHDKLIELHLDYFGRQIRRTCELMTVNDVYVFDIVNNCILKNGMLFEKYEETINDKYIEELRFFYQLMQDKVQNVNTLQHAVEVMKIADGQSR